MKFLYQKGTGIYAGKLMYILKEQSLYFEPFSKQANFSVMISGAYTSLDVNHENGEAKHISGCNPKHLWKNRKLQMPDSIEGKLFAQFDESVISGSGVYYAKDWLTYYDPQNNLICIGNPETADNDVCIEFASEVYATLRKDQLIAVWARAKET